MSGSDRKQYTIGIWYALAAYTTWGFLPLFWKTLESVTAWEVLAHRIVWSLVFVTVLLLLNGRWKQVRSVFSIRKNLLAMITSGVLISFNWVTFIWAVNSDHVIDTSLGYYITPLFNIFLGMAVFRERLNFWQNASFVLAIIGVAIITIHNGSIPWVAVILTLTFSLYGLVKKTVQIDPVMGLAVETLFVTPAALFYIFYLQLKGTSMFITSSISLTLLLIASGVATAVPLLWFAQAAKRIPLSMVGFIQYLSPSITLILGVFLFKEPFTVAHLISFGFIWGALVLYTFSHHRILVELQPERFKGVG